MKWNRTNPREIIHPLPQPADNEIEIIWNIPADQESGTYKIGHMGAAKNHDGTIAPYTGYSEEFTVREADPLVTFFFIVFFFKSMESTFLSLSLFFAMENSLLNYCHRVKKYAF